MLKVMFFLSKPFKMILEAILLLLKIINQDDGRSVKELLSENGYVKFKSILSHL